MIDPPVVQRALKLVERAKRMGSCVGAGLDLPRRVQLDSRVEPARRMPNESNWPTTPPDAWSRPWSTASRRFRFLGVGKYQPRGRKAAPPIRSNKDYPDNGDKRVPDLETALRKCGLRDGMVISNHHHLRDGDRGRAHGARSRRQNRRQRSDVVSQRVVSRRRRARSN